MSHSDDLKYKRFRISKDFCWIWSFRLSESVNSVALTWSDLETSYEILQLLLQNFEYSCVIFADSYSAKLLWSSPIILDEHSTLAVYFDFLSEWPELVANVWFGKETNSFGVGLGWRCTLTVVWFGGFLVKPWRQRVHCFKILYPVWSRRNEILITDSFQLKKTCL